MSLHDLMASDLAAITHDTAHGFAREARLAGRYRVRGLFDEDYIEIGGAEGRGPAFTCAESDLPDGLAGNVRHGDELIVQATRGALRYSVVGVQPDGHGEVRLLLEEFDT